MTRWPSRARRADLLGHGRNRAVEARCGLRLQREVLAFVRTFDSQLFDGDHGCPLHAGAPLLRREVKIFGTDEIADKAAFVRLGYFCPPSIVRFFERVRFVEQDNCTG